MEFEVGAGKQARRAYGFDEVAIVPSRRTRDPDDVDISWDIDAYRFELPMMASAMDGAVSPATAIEIGRLGGLAVLNLEGLWTRYEDPEPVFDEVAAQSDEKATRRMQELYQEPIKEELIGRRIREIKEAGVVAAASLTPQRVSTLAGRVLEAELDILVIQGTVVSAEHVSTQSEPLNLKEFIANFDLPVVGGGFGDDRFAPHPSVRGAGTGVPLGHGHVPSDAPPRGTGGHEAGGFAGGDPGGPGARERRHAQSVRRPSHVHGHHGLREHQGVPESRAGDRALHPLRGQELPAGPAPRDSLAGCRKALAPSWSSTSGRSM